MDETRHVAALRAIREIADRHPRVTLDLPFEQALELVGTIQLALRHPAFRGRHSARHMEIFVRTLICELAGDSEALFDVLMMGFDPVHDEATGG